MDVSESSSLESHPRLFLKRQVREDRQIAPGNLSPRHLGEGSVASAKGFASSRLNFFFLLASSSHLAIFFVLAV